MSNPVCPSCGTPYPPGAAFCSHCGEKLVTAVPAPQAPVTPAPNPQTVAVPQPSNISQSTSTPIQATLPSYAPTPSTPSIATPPVTPSYSAPTPPPPMTHSYSAPTYQAPAYAPPNTYGGQAVASVGLEKIGFGPRLVAALVDGIILSVLYRFVGNNVFRMAISLAYYTFMTGQFGWTAGKKLMNIRVVNLDGSPLNYQQAAIRYFCYIVSALPLFLGYLAVLWDPNRQGWHDKIAGTYVVKG